MPRLNNYYFNGFIIIDSKMIIYMSYNYAAELNR